MLGSGDRLIVWLFLFFNVYCLRIWLILLCLSLIVMELVMVGDGWFVI